VACRSFARMRLARLRGQASSGRHHGAGLHRHRLRPKPESPRAETAACTNDGVGTARDVDGASAAVWGLASGYPGGDGEGSNSGAVWATNHQAFLPEATHEVRYDVQVLRGPRSNLLTGHGARAHRGEARRGEARRGEARRGEARRGERRGDGPPMSSSIMFLIGAGACTNVGGGGVCRSADGNATGSHGQSVWVGA
jgi:hypothetical protein